MPIRKSHRRGLSSKIWHFSTPGVSLTYVGEHPTRFIWNRIPLHSSYKNEDKTNSLPAARSPNCQGHQGEARDSFAAVGGPKTKKTYGACYDKRWKQNENDE